MKVAFCSESAADQSALAIFFKGVTNVQPEPYPLEANGVGRVLTNIRPVFRGLHYNSDVEGLIIVVDRDNTSMHEENHDENSAATEKCRFCKIHKQLAEAKKGLKPRPGLPELKIAVGLAVPAIEAWYLTGINHQVGEAAWKVHPPFNTRQLKQKLYGTDRPSIELETKVAIREAQRIVDVGIEKLEQEFPIGFGLLSQEIRNWFR